MHAQEVVSTNLLGSIYGSRAAMRVMRTQQPPGGKIFLMDGQGANGGATPKNAAYGSSKHALVQLKVGRASVTDCRQYAHTKRSFNAGLGHPGQQLSFNRHLSMLPMQIFICHVRFP